MMEINLRKANAIQSEIRSAINGISFANTITVSEYDAQPEEVIAKANETFKKDYHRKMQLNNALFDVRSKVARANAAAGISDVLAQIAVIDSQIANETKVSQLSVRKSAEEICARIEKFKTAPATERSVIYGDRYNNIETGFVDAEVVEGAKKLIKNFKRERQNLSDKLLQLNVTTTIVLKDDSMATLKEEGIL